MTLQRTITIDGRRYTGRQLARIIGPAASEHILRNGVILQARSGLSADGCVLGAGASRLCDTEDADRILVDFFAGRQVEVSL